MPKIITSFSNNITVNGKSYGSIDELPEDLQEILKDEDQNGRIDIVDNAVKEFSKSSNDLTSRPDNYTQSSELHIQRPEHSQPTLVTPKLQPFQKTLIVMVILGTLIFLLTLL